MTSHPYMKSMVHGYQEYAYGITGINDESKDCRLGNTVLTLIVQGTTTG